MKMLKFKKENLMMSHFNTYLLTLMGIPVQWNPNGNRHCLICLPWWAFLCSETHMETGTAWFAYLDGHSCAVKPKWKQALLDLLTLMAFLCSETQMETGTAWFAYLDGHSCAVKPKWKQSLLDLLTLMGIPVQWNPNGNRHCLICLPWWAFLCSETQMETVTAWFAYLDGHSCAAKPKWKQALLDLLTLMGIPVQWNPNGNSHCLICLPWWAFLCSETQMETGTAWFAYLDGHSCSETQMETGTAWFAYLDGHSCAVKPKWKQALLDLLTLMGIPVQWNPNGNRHCLICLPWWAFLCSETQMETGTAWFAYLDGHSCAVKPKWKQALLDLLTLMGIPVQWNPNGNRHCLICLPWWAFLCSETQMETGTAWFAYLDGHSCAVKPKWKQTLLAFHPLITYRKLLWKSNT